MCFAQGVFAFIKRRIFAREKIINECSPSLCEGVLLIEKAMRIAIFPGTFDPFTVGHQSIVERALPLVDRLIVAVGVNSQKKPLISVEKRLEMISDIFADESKIEVTSYSGLTMDFAKKVEAKIILRGVRNALDFEYESSIARINWKMSGIDSMFLLTHEEHSSISSSIVRDLMIHGGDVSDFIPSNVDIKAYL